MNWTGWSPASSMANAARRIGRRSSPTCVSVRAVGRASTPNRRRSMCSTRTPPSRARWGFHRRGVPASFVSVSRRCPCIPRSSCSSRSSAPGLLGFWLRPTPVIAVGVIGDSYCQHDHSGFTTRFNVGERECTLGCVKRGAEFVLVTDTQVYRIHNQQLPELAAFANRRVKVEGTWAGDRIVVASMAAADAPMARCAACASRARTSRRAASGSRR